MSLETYPVLVLPEFVLDYLKNKNKLTTNLLPAANKPFVVTQRRRIFSQMQQQWVKRIWQGLFGTLGAILFLGLIWSWLGGDPTSTISWAGFLIVSLLLYWGGMQFLKYCSQVQLREHQRAEELYWQQNQANNERLRQESRAKLRRKIVLRNERNGKLKRSLPKSRGIVAKDSLVRGEIKGDAPKGVSEAYLAKFLQQYFSDCQICEDYFAIEGTNLGYTTDFSIIEPTTGIGIDLEVDEPYEGRYKQPHHCTDDGKDRRRNNYLVERGWIVLRVSEFQVVSQPESVCKLIAQILDRLSIKSHYLEPLSSFPDLKYDPTWNSVGVRSMVYRQYRERYLDKYGIFAYDEKREQRNAEELVAKKKQARKDAKKRKRANLKAWRQKNKRS